MNIDTERREAQCLLNASSTAAATGVEGGGGGGSIAFRIVQRCDVPFPLFVSLAAAAAAAVAAISKERHREDVAVCKK